MPSSRAIAIRREQAIAGLESAALAHATALELPPVELPSHRDQAVAETMRIEALTAFLEDATKAVYAERVAKTARKSKAA